ncbi:MAG: hypothetical protein ACOCUT_01440 [bacterium]
MGILKKSIYGIIKLSSINPYNNNDGYVNVELSNVSSSEDYNLTILQDSDIIGYAGDKKLSAGLYIYGKMRPSDINAAWSDNGFIGIEFDFNDDLILQRQLDGSEYVIIGEAYNKFSRTNLSKKEEQIKDLPNSVF